MIHDWILLISYITVSKYFTHAYTHPFSQKKTPLIPAPQQNLFQPTKAEARSAFACSPGVPTSAESSFPWGAPVMTEL